MGTKYFLVARHVGKLVKETLVNIDTEINEWRNRL